MLFALLIAQPCAIVNPQNLLLFELQDCYFFEIFFYCKISFLKLFLRSEAGGSRQTIPTCRRSSWLRWCVAYVGSHYRVFRCAARQRLGASVLAGDGVALLVAVIGERLAVVDEGFLQSDVLAVGLGDLIAEGGLRVRVVRQVLEGGDLRWAASERISFTFWPPK